MSLNRTLAGLIDASGELTSGGGLDVYATLDDLPTTGLTSGDQAYVSATSRFYISNGSGWYNVALVNATPNLTISPSGAIELNTDGSTTTITLTATDSDYPDAALTFSVDSDGSFGGLGTISQDSSVFTITPLSEDSATTTSSTLTFKASDGISFGSGTSAITLRFSIQNSKYTTLLLQADTAGTDNQTDASTNSLSITEYGNVTSTALSPYHPGGYSTYFDGNDYISIADGTYKTLGSDPWTYECWVYPTSVAAGNKWILGDHASSGSGATTSANLVLNGANFGIFCRTSAGGNISVNESTTRSVNQWYHLALVFDQSNVILYVDGTAVITQSHTSGFNDGSGSFSVGRTGDYNGSYYTGYVRDVRLVKGTAVYTSAFTPPTSSLTAITNTQLLLCHLPYIADGSTNDHTISTGGTPSTIRFIPYDYRDLYVKADHGGSVHFDGNGDYMDVTTSTAADFGTGDFTVEVWWYPTTPTQNGVLWGGFTNATNTSNNVCEFYLGLSTGWLRPHINTNFNNTWTTRISTTEFCNDKAWNHVAYVRNGNVGNIYINGKKGPDNAIDGAAEFNNPFSSLRVFRSWQTTTSYGKGYLADLRIVKGTALYTSDFTPPTVPLTAISNTELLTMTNKNNIWDVSSGSQVMTKNGNVTASNTQRNFLTSSAMYFDGNGDYIDFVKKAEYSFESGIDFTVEGWWYMNSIAGRPHFIGMGTGIDGTPAHYSDWNMYYNGSNQLTFYYYNGSTAIPRNFAWTPVVNTWYHITVSRNGTDLKAFVNGNQIGSTITDSTNFSGAAGSRPLRIGRWQYGGGTNGYLNGYAQDIRITKGLARYTANFTPPTSQFSG